MPKGTPHAPGNSTDSRYSAFARLSLMNPELDAWVIYCQVFGHNYDAGNVPQWLRANASKYFNHPKVQEWIHYYQGLLVDEFKIKLEGLLGELEEARQAALHKGPTPQAAAAVSATMGKAKLLGMDKQVIDHMSSDGSFSPAASQEAVLAALARKYAED